jgi:hypothetical protein
MSRPRIHFVLLYALRDGYGLCLRVFTACAICQDTGLRWNLCDPPAIGLAVEFNLKISLHL